jgi:hypothetical protein
VSATFTTSRTFTITHARYVTSKVAADLRQLRSFYGRPSEASIEDYAEEAALLLRDGYLERVDYGFQRNDRWVLLLRYHARSDGTLSDENAGRVPAGIDITGTSFSSYLTHTARYYALTAAEREEVDAALPILRSHGAEAGFVVGTWGGTRSYSSGDTGVQRSIFRPQ